MHWRSLLTDVAGWIGQERSMQDLPSGRAGQQLAAGETVQESSPEWKVQGEIGRPERS